MNSRENRNIRVLYILHATIMGGATIAVWHLLQELPGYGIEPIVVIPKNLPMRDNGSELVTELNRNNIVVERCWVNPLAFPLLKKGTCRELVNKIKYRLKRYMSMKDLATVIEKYKPDIIHTNTGVIQEGYFLAKRYHIPHVWHLREYQDLDFKWKLYPPKKIVQEYVADSYTICITNDIKHHFSLENNPQAHVIYDPLFSKKNIVGIKERTGHYFLVANRLSPEKCVEDIIKAFALFSASNEGYELLLAGFGDKEYVSSLKKLCDEQGISNKVRFLGYRRDVKKLMEDALALLVASRHEGFGMMTAEANMTGCPVIGRNSAGTKEIIEHTGGGYLFDDWREMARCMSTLCGMSSVERMEWMRKPQQIAIDTYSQEHSAYDVAALYNNIVEQAKKEN